MTRKKMKNTHASVHLFFITWYILSDVTTGLPQHTLAVTDDVSMTSSASDVTPGLTDLITVDCILTRVNQSQFSSVTSLIISKSSSSQEMASSHNFVETVSLTRSTNSAAGPDRVSIKDTTLGGQASGHIERLGDARLTFTIQKPTRAACGMYKCEAFGADIDGHPKTSVATTLVKEKPVDFAVLVAKMNEVRERQNEKISYLTNALDNATFQHVRTEMQLKNEIHDLRDELTELRDEHAHIETGDVSCMTEGTKTVTFSRPYNKPPKVFVALTDYKQDAEDQNVGWWFYVNYITNVSCKIHCVHYHVGTGDIEYYSVRWMSLP